MNTMNGAHPAADMWRDTVEEAAEHRTVEPLSRSSGQLHPGQPKHDRHKDRSTLMIDI